MQFRACWQVIGNYQHISNEIGVYLLNGDFDKIYHEERYNCPAVILSGVNLLSLKDLLELLNP